MGDVPTGIGLTAGDGNRSAWFVWAVDHRDRAISLVHDEGTFAVCGHDAIDRRDADRNGCS